MIITLNGNIYELQKGTGVSRTPVSEWVQNIRMTGQQKRSDRSLVSSWVIDDWSGGLGQERTIGYETNRLWDAECADTRWKGQIVRSPAFNTCTLNPAATLPLAFPYLDELYFLESDELDFMAYKFTPPFTLGSFSRLTTEGTLINLTAIKAFGGDIAFVADNDYVANYNHLHKSGGIGSSSSDIAYKLPASTYQNTQLGDLGGTLHLLQYISNKAHFHIADQDIGTPYPVASISTVIGSYLSPLDTDGLTMYANLPEGIYNFDATPNILVDTTRSRDKNCSQVVFGQKLYFKNKKSLIEYSSTGSLSGVGYDIEDGLPSDKMGEITAMTASWKWIFAAVKGATYSHILTKDAQNVWQYYARIPTAGLWVREMFLSDSPDGYDRLWCLFDNYPYPGYFLNPMINPLMAGTYAYVPTGHFTPPYFEGGMPEELGGFYDLVFSGKHASGQRIYINYGIDGSNPVATLPSYVTQSHQAFTFGSPSGVEAYKMQAKFSFTHGTLGSTSKFEEAVVHYLKIPKTREMFDFTVDVENSSHLAGITSEEVIGSLNYERDLRTLIPLHYGNIGTKNVKVFDAPASEETREQRVYEGGREGFVKLRCIEMIP